jgi:hypothetical protein
VNFALHGSGVFNWNCRWVPKLRGVVCNCRRNPSYNASRIVYCVVLSVLLGTVYLWKGQAR